MVKGSLEVRLEVKRVVRSLCDVGSPERLGKSELLQTSSPYLNIRILSPLRSFWKHSEKLAASTPSLVSRLKFPTT